MVLRLRDEEVVFKLPEAMRHTLDLNDTSYFVDDIDIIISDCMLPVFSMDPLEEYLGKLSDDGEEAARKEKNEEQEVATMT